MKLQKKLGLVFILIALLPFISGMTFIMLKTSRTIKKNAQGFMTEYTGSIAGDIGTFFADESGYVEALATMPAVRTFGWAGVKDTLDALAKQNGTFDTFILGRADGSYFRADQKGNPARGGLITEDNENPDAPPLSLSSRDYFLRLITNNPGNERMTVLSNPNLSKSTGKKQIIVVTNVFDDEGTVSGFLGATVSGERFERELDSITALTGAHFGKEATILIVSDSGAVASMRAYSKEEDRYVETLLNRSEEFTLDVLPADFSKAVADSLSASQPSSAYRDSENRTVYEIACQPVPGTNYSVILQIPERKLYSAFYDILNSLVTISFLTVIIVLALSLVLGGRLARPLMNTAKTLKDISEGKGDLTYRLTVSGRDETSDVGNYFNKFIETLHGMMTEVKAQTDTMGDISGQLVERSGIIKSDIEGITANVSDLNFQTEEQSASVTETSSTIHQIAKNIESLSRQIEGQSASVTESSAAIQQMVSNINSISTNLERASGGFESLLTASNNGRDTMQGVIELVKEVSSQSEQLLETNEIIDSIASQTNLLAMNAAIEAAHAGEAGKGFSVVSDEIRKLAESSSEQSKVIAGELKKVVTTIATIVGASAKADNAFGVVAAQIKEANGLIQEISMSMKEQTEGSRQVLEALDDIQNITIQIRDGSMEMNQGTGMILKEMARLEDISLKVQKSTREIARASDTIGETIEEILSVTGRNTEVVNTLNEQTGRFKL